MDEKRKQYEAKQEADRQALHLRDMVLIATGAGLCGLGLLGYAALKLLGVL
jgi:hypothetical protein